MTSLIFGSIYMGHKGIVNYRREKQRTKNYERWEGLRDEYDAQKKIGRETRSLDLQRTGNGWEDATPYQQQDGPRDILTLRDQQEANDARTGWRPQESWEPSVAHFQAMQAQQTGRSSSVDAQRLPTYGTGVQNVTAMKPTKTGAWDDGLPAPLRVARMSYDGGENISAYSTPGRLPTPIDSRTPSMSQPNLASSRTSSARNSGRNTPQLQLPQTMPTPLQQQIVADVPILENDIPGGKIAQLLEDLKTPAEQKDMEEWWK